jgi:hypothetical protein
MFGYLGMHEKFRDQGPECNMGPAGKTGPECRMCAMPGMRMHGFAGRHIHRLMFLGLMIMGILNILLTIIVAMDMSRIGKFNGIWIAVTLLCGVPGTAIYALFRIGDAIERVKQKDLIRSQRRYVLQTGFGGRGNEPFEVYSLHAIVCFRIFGAFCG